ARLIHPHLSIEASRVHDECVPVPFSCGIPLPRWWRVFGKLTPIEVDLAPLIEGLVDNHDVIGHLNNLPWPGRCNDSRHTLRQAVCGRLLSRKRARFALIV